MLKKGFLHKARPIDFDLAGMGQFYCTECSRYLIDAKEIRCGHKNQATQGLFEWTTPESAISERGSSRRQHCASNKDPVLTITN